MPVEEFTARVRGKRVLELPKEADSLNLRPGDQVRVTLVTANGLKPNADRPRPGEQKRPSASTKPKVLKSWGILAGATSVDDFLRRKHEETEREDMPISERLRP